jgi:glutathione S-transferase
MISPDRLLETGMCRIRKVRREGCLKIYFAPDTRAVRIVWLFEELGLPYELEFFKLGDASMRSPAYLGIHPLGRVPTLVDDKVTIFESGAIVQYVLAKYGCGRLTPDVGSKEFPVYLQWFHFADDHAPDKHHCRGNGPSFARASEPG